MEEVKISKKSKVGILSFVTGFEEFAELAETIFRNAERRGDLDKAYVKVIKAVFMNGETSSPWRLLEHGPAAGWWSLITALVVCSGEGSQRKPEDASGRGHDGELPPHLFHTLASEDLLPGRRKAGGEAEIHRPSAVLRHQFSGPASGKAQRRWEERRCLWAPFLPLSGSVPSALQHFFEGVEARVAQGVREEEVSYHLAFNKQELRKVIKEYPGKEVKKGLDNLYKKVDKHLCEEESLLQVQGGWGGSTASVASL